MSDNAYYALTQGFGRTAIALVIGYILYKLIRAKGSPTKASDYGRQWMAWIAMLTTMGLLPKFIGNQNLDTFASWLVPFIAFGLIAFIFGLIYGKFKKPKNSSTDVSDEEATKTTFMDIFRSKEVEISYPSTSVVTTYWRGQTKFEITRESDTLTKHTTYYRNGNKKSETTFEEDIDCMEHTYFLE